MSQGRPFSLPCTRVLSISDKFCRPFLLALECPSRENPSLGSALPSFRGFWNVSLPLLRVRKPRRRALPEDPPSCGCAEAGAVPGSEGLL